MIKWIKKLLCKHSQTFPLAELILKDEDGIILDKTIRMCGICYKLIYVDREINNG